MLMGIEEYLRELGMMIGARRCYNASVCVINLSFRSN